MLAISTIGKRFIDSEGRQRIFNGVNLCDKGTPNEAKTKKEYFFNFDEELIIRLKQSGFNLVRLGLTWDAIEPEPEKYDDECIARLRKVADLCEKHGIYFFLDMHQDLYGGTVTTPADGAPGWACLTDGYKFKDTKFVWAEGYFWGKAVHRSFDNFWENKSYKGKPLQTYYCNMWKYLTEQFKDSTALFGFDVMNEPFPGTDGGKVFRKIVSGAVKTVLFDKRCPKAWMLKQILTKGNFIKVLEPFEDKDLFRKVTLGGDALIKKFDLERYSPFINRTAKAIRSVTDNGIIIMENCYYSNTGIPCSTPAVNYDGIREEKLCFAPHGYDLMVDTPAYKYASNSRVSVIFDEHLRTQQRLNVPVVVGEWGGHSDGCEWLHHINFLLDKFDENQWGQTYWAYYDGMLDNPIMESLVRTAPIAVTGKIVKYGLDRENDCFSLEYIQDATFASPTEIYIHKAYKSIETDGKYIVEPLEGCNAFKMKIITPPGTHKVTIQF